MVMKMVVKHGTCKHCRKEFEYKSRYGRGRPRLRCNECQGEFHRKTTRDNQKKRMNSPGMRQKNRDYQRARYNEKIKKLDEQEQADKITSSQQIVEQCMSHEDTEIDVENSL